ncbi:MAG: hypothetical protein AAFN05_12090, partial [Pseudomonadota bacterium]
RSHSVTAFADSAGTDSLTRQETMDLVAEWHYFRLVWSGRSGMILAVCIALMVALGYVVVLAARPEERQPVRIRVDERDERARREQELRDRHERF